MATSQAIQAATSTLISLLTDRMDPKPQTSVGAPTAEDGKRLNLFLYRVQESAALRNQDSPDPRTMNAPPLSLDLFYLVSVLGTTPDEELGAQQMLGDAMLVLHDFGIISPDLPLVRTTGKVLDPLLADEVERLTISSNPLTLEDLTKIWTSLAIPYRLSAGYVVTVVQMRSRKQRHVAPPVRERKLFVVPMNRPAIAEVARSPQFDGIGSAVAEPGDVISVLGVNLRSISTRVDVGSSTLVPTSIDDTRVEAKLPANAAAGIVTVTVTRDGADGPPPVAPRFLRSNAVPLRILPVVSSWSATSGPATTTLGATLVAPVKPGDDVSLLIGDLEVPAEARTIASANVTFKLTPIAALLTPGRHLLRVRVNGVESRLGVDPTSGAYATPAFQVT